MYRSIIAVAKMVVELGEEYGCDSVGGNGDSCGVSVGSVVCVGGVGGGSEEAIYVGETRNEITVVAAMNDG